MLYKLLSYCGTRRLHPIKSVIVLWHIKLHLLLEVFVIVRPTTGLVKVVVEVTSGLVEVTVIVDVTGGLVEVTQWSQICQCRTVLCEED